MTEAKDRVRGFVRDHGPILLVVAVAFGLRLAPVTGYVYNDEVGAGYTGYGYLAWGYMDTVNVYAQYLRTLDLGGLFSWSLLRGSLTPLTPMLAAFSTFLLPSMSPLDAARVPVAILSALTCLPIYYFGAWTFDRRTGLLAAFAWAVNTSGILYGRLLYEDAGGVFFGMLALALLVRPRRSSRWTALVLPGICLGLAMSSKLLSLIFLGAIVLGNVRWRHLFAKAGGPRAWFVGAGIRPWSQVAVIGVSGLATMAVVFPWLLPALAVRTGLATNYVTPNAPLAYRVIQLPLILLGRLDPATILLAALGFAGFVRARWRKGPLGFGTDLLFGWLLAAAVIGVVVSSFLYQYVVFVLPPVLLLMAVGFWRAYDFAAAELAAHSPRPVAGDRADGGEAAETAPAEPRGFRAVARRDTLIKSLFVVLLLALLLLPMTTNFADPGLYYSPLVGGIRIGARFLPVEGNEVLPDVAAFIRSHYPPGSVIIAYGSVHLVKYWLPEYQVRGVSEFYPEYLADPLAFFAATNASAFVIQQISVQGFPDDPLIVALSHGTPIWQIDYGGLPLAWVYDRSALGGFAVDHVATPPFPGWTAPLGTWSANGTLTVNAGVGAAEVQSAALSAPCPLYVAALLGAVAPSAQKIRLEYLASNGMPMVNTSLVPAASEAGMLFLPVPAWACVGSGQPRIAIVVMGDPGAYVQFTKVVVLRPA